MNHGVLLPIQLDDYLLCDDKALELLLDNYYSTDRDKCCANKPKICFVSLLCIQILKSWALSAILQTGFLSLRIDDISMEISYIFHFCRRCYPFLYPFHGELSLRQKHLFGRNVRRG
jgi:hypothetical protein